MSGISVVIPTYKRPDAVCAAVRSALAQTVKPQEIIVVIDGRDRETAARLAGFGDAVKPILPPANLGNAEARNHGIRHAKGPLIALLDDDDFWMPGKLDAQLGALRASAAEMPVVSCRLAAVSETARFVWPRRLPRAGEPIGDYLFTRKRPGTGEGLAQTSTLLAPKRLFETVPFSPGLPRYVDLDWLLTAGAEGATLTFPKEEAPLSRWSIDERRERITTSARWRWDLAFAEERKPLMTGRARAAFLLTLASLTATREGDRSAFLPLLRRALAAGRPSAAELAFHAGNLALPFSVKDVLASRLAPTRSVKGGPA